MTTKKRHCKLCKAEYSGRTDKLYCSVKCKSTYSQKLNAVTKKETGRIDKILHRNRSILLEILGKKIVQTKVLREELDSRNFNYSYVTQYHLNSKNKMVNYVYDFSWIVFSDQEILVRRIRKSK